MVHISNGFISCFYLPISKTAMQMVCENKNQEKKQVQETRSKCHLISMRIQMMRSDLSEEVFVNRETQLGKSELQSSFFI